MSYLRVTLPTLGIESLDQTQIEISSKIGIFISDSNKQVSMIKDLENLFSNHQFLKINFIPLQLNEESLKAAKTPASLEKILLTKYTHFGYGDFVFIEWLRLTDDILVTADRTAFMSPQVTSNKIQNVLKNWLFEEHNLRSILGNLTTSDGNVVRNVNAPPQPQIDVLISVLNPRPDLQNVIWNVRKASEDYIAPFLNSIGVLSNFTLKSQWKYELDFDLPVKQIQDESKLMRHFTLPEDRLPHIITSIERKLGNEVSKNRCIHLVVYVPPCSKAPLYIYKTNGVRASNNSVNAFLSANWGGVIIENPPESHCIEYMEKEDKIEFHLNSQNVMQVSLYLLRKIFGIQNDIPITNAVITDLETLTPRTWEIETFVRTRVVHLLASATLTLKSLIKLLGDISYIVINDDVGSAINVAYENILIAKKHLSEGKLEIAAKFAKEAFENAERAFFDPTLLALLYFPDEQKYVILIVLFDFNIFYCINLFQKILDTQFTSHCFYQ